MAELNLKALVLTGLVGVGGLSLTNPDRDAYTEYAIAEVSRNCPSFICEPIGTFLHEPIQSLVRTNTKRYNLVVLSVYNTEIMGVFEATTVGILGNFVTLSTAK